MKKLFFFAVIAALMTACSESDTLNSNVLQQTTVNDGSVKFDVYAQRGITRGGGQRGDLNNKNIGKNGFGVFAYYTAGESYSTKSEPNFMFNQKVYLEGDQEAKEGLIWKYEPVKYWPNEFGDAAISDNTDMISFFAYAPWTPFDPATGDIDAEAINYDCNGDTLTGESIEHRQKYNIVSVGKNSMNGDPIIKYVVDTDPGTSVDLLWGVAAEKANEAYTPIDGNAGSTGANSGVFAKQGLPFIDMVKPNNPSQDRLMFNLKHALAKVKITIDYIKDMTTPTDSNGYTVGKVEPQAEWMQDAFVDDVINPDETRIFVRKFTISGWANQGALNLNNTEAGEPLWKDFDGQKDLAFPDEGVTFVDQRKDNGKEGTAGGDAKSEGIGGLNPSIIENFALTETDSLGKTKFGKDKNPGVPKYGEEVLLFGGDTTKNDGYFYIIPRNSNEPVNVTIMYDVETIDDALKAKLSDDKTHGSSIENIITKEDIFNGLDFKAGYQYFIKIHLGMTSVKIEATVQPWVDNEETHVNLPDNQDPEVDAEEGDLTVTVNTFNQHEYNFEGKVTGAGKYFAGSNVTLKAADVNGYTFVRWGDDSTTDYTINDLQEDKTVDGYYEGKLLSELYQNDKRVRLKFLTLLTPSDGTPTTQEVEICIKDFPNTSQQDAMQLYSFNIGDSGNYIYRFAMGEEIRVGDTVDVYHSSSQQNPPSSWLSAGTITLLKKVE